jgi:5-methyltetrahydropteroyltriglutamate--homocysteine methyltransferase
MTNNGRTSFRAEVIGSLPKPAYMVDAWVGYYGRPPLFQAVLPSKSPRKLNTAEFKRIEDSAVDQVIALQERAGVDVVNDGEMRRGLFTDALTRALEGVEKTPLADSYMGIDKGLFGPGNPEMITSKIRRRRAITIEEFTYLRAKTRKATKVTMPSPLMAFLMYLPKYSASAYPDPFNLFVDAADILRQECVDLAALGCEYIQFDAPELGFVCVPEQKEPTFDARKIDLDRFVNEGVEILNSAATVPGVKFGLHVCRGGGGRRMYPQQTKASYDAISQQVFKRATNFDVFLLEYDDSRSGGFEALKDVPDDKTVALGLVDNPPTPPQETPEFLIGRIEEASQFFPKENLALATRCGLLPSTIDNAEAILRLVADVSRRVWD